MSFFGFLVLLVIFFFVLRPLFRVAMAMHRQRQAWSDLFRAASQQQQGQRQQRSRRQAAPAQPPRKKKVFGRDEGEYVDFVEITEEEAVFTELRTDEPAPAGKRGKGQDTQQVSDADYEEL